MTQIPQNLVDLAHLSAPPALRCGGCRVPLRQVHGRFLDGIGHDTCPDGVLHLPQVAPSPMGGWLRP